MEEAEASTVDDWSLFLEGESFNLFGDYDLNIDFNSALDPGYHEINSSFDFGEWDDPSEAVNPAPLDINLQSPALDEWVDSGLTATADCSISSYFPDISSSSARSLHCGDQDSASGSPNSITGSEHQPKASEPKRKYFTAFSANSGRDVRLHTRKRFSEEQKKVVALNRTIGVCLHCRLRKVAVS